MKICSTCKIEKSETDFYKRRAAKSGVMARCKKCSEAHHKAKLGGLSSSDLAARKQDERRWHLKRTYGLTERKYDDMTAAQGNVCAICKGNCKTKGSLCVDHCHTTGEIRGLLCRLCNIALGAIGESPEILRKAAEYLEKFSKAKR